ncbi:MAG: hypothetical protein ACMUEL_04845 [Flavobacteriales bacterium Tduv]
MRIATNEDDSRGLKPLISKLGYKTRQIYADKTYYASANVSTFIVEASKTVYRRKPIGTVP